MKNEAYANNEYIEMAITEVHRTRHVEAFYTVIEVLMKRMSEGGEAPMPMVVSEGFFPLPEIPETENLEEIAEALVGQTVTFKEDVKFGMDTMQDSDGKQWIPLFTSEEELSKQPTTNITMNIAIEQILRAGLAGDDVEGIVINPFGEYLEIPKRILEITFEHYKR